MARRAERARPGRMTASVQALKVLIKRTACCMLEASVGYYSVLDSPPRVRTPQPT